MILKHGATNSQKHPCNYGVLIPNCFDRSVIPAKSTYYLQLSSFNESLESHMSE